MGAEKGSNRKAGQVSWLASLAGSRPASRLQWRNRGGFAPPSPIKPKWVLAPGVHSSSVKWRKADNNVSVSWAVVNVGSPLTRTRDYVSVTNAYSRCASSPHAYPRLWPGAAGLAECRTISGMNDGPPLQKIERSDDILASDIVGRREIDSCRRQGFGGQSPPQPSSPSW